MMCRIEIWIQGAEGDYIRVDYIQLCIRCIRQVAIYVSWAQSGAWRLRYGTCLQQIIRQVIQSHGHSHAHGRCQGTAGMARQILR